MRKTITSFYFSALITISLSLFTAGATLAQDATPSPSPSPSPTRSLERDFFKNVLRDQKSIWTAPLHLRVDDANWMVPGAVGLAALIATDRTTGDKMAEFDGPKNASRIISYAGSVYGIAAVAGTFYVVGRADHNQRARETGVLTAEAALNSAIVVTALKGITQRVRPYGGADRSKFFVGGNSFPSGHSIEAWSMATIVANEYHDHRLVQIAAYGIASAVSVARFTGGAHYLSDVLVGSALGYGIGRYVYKTHHRSVSLSSGDDSGFSDSRWPAITPEYNRQARAYGVGLRWNF